MAGHSQYSCSTWPRATTCAASVKASLKYPDESSVFADEGTAAHFVSELCLSKKRMASAYAGCVVAVPPHDVVPNQDGSWPDCFFVHEKRPAPENWRTFEVGDEMVHETQRYIDWCAEAPGEHFVEVRVDVSDVTPIEDQKGTSDHIACAPGLLIVTDLKYGKGEQVFALNNKQALGYAWGAFKEFDWLYDFQKIIIRICQPRLNHFDVWEIDREELFKHIEQIRRDLAKCEEPNPAFTPEPHACRFCKHAPYCEALKEHTFNTRAMAFDDLTEEFVYNVPSLTEEDLNEAWHQIPLIQVRINAIENEVARLLAKGRQLEGIRMVESITHRVWTKPQEAEKFLIAKGVDRSKIRPPSKFALSPSQAEKLLPSKVRKELAPFWVRPPGQPVVVKADDKRPDYADRHSHAFVDEDEDWLT